MRVLPQCSTLFYDVLDVKPWSILHPSSSWSTHEVHDLPHKPRSLHTSVWSENETQKNPQNNPQSTESIKYITCLHSKTDSDTPNVQSILKARSQKLKSFKFCLQSPTIRSSAMWDHKTRLHPTCFLDMSHRISLAISFTIQMLGTPALLQAPHNWARQFIAFHSSVVNVCSRLPLYFWCIACSPCLLHLQPLHKKCSNSQELLETFNLSHHLAKRVD